MITVGPPGLQQKDAELRVFAQAVCKHATCGTGTYDDVVVATFQNVGLIHCFLPHSVVNFPGSVDLS